MSNESLDRRNFLKSVGATGLTLSAANSALAAAKSSSKSSGRVIEATS